MKKLIFGLILFATISCNISESTQKLSNNLNFFNDSSTIDDIKNNLSENNYKLIYRYNSFNCITCFIDNITILSDFKHKIGIKNILVVLNYENDIRMTKRYKTMLEDIDFINSYNTKKKSRDFFAIVDKNGIVINVFYPKKNIKELENYLSLVSKFISNKNINQQ